mmetsp:Transcript_71392/g.158739  ORF Transcript_71392/g.158739 Transcript_71392/m.158739 type:complete len:150 (-) Transcript_71392:344-793(-)
MEDKPERTLFFPHGISLRIAKVHPAWTSVMLATNEALEVRELRRSAADTLQLREPDDRRINRGLVLKWRRDNLQVTAAAFIAQGNMLVVSDRGDRLLLLNYHGLHAAKRIILPWSGVGLSIPSARNDYSSHNGAVCTVFGFSSQVLIVC